MSDRIGISGGGRSAEDLFRQMTGAAPTERAAQGDALLDGYPVEVKRATRVTLNQVRAVKYLPIVVHHAPVEDWYVVPAHVVVAIVSQKRRGQHTENPFESATLSLKSLHAWKVDAPSRLREATLEAIAASDEYPELRSAMEDVLRESRELADRSSVVVSGSSGGRALRSVSCCWNGVKKSRSTTVTSLMPSRLSTSSSTRRSPSIRSIGL